MVRRLLLAACVLPFAMAGAETTFHPAMEVVTNLETTADPNYNPVVARTAAPGGGSLVISWLGYNEAREQVLLTMYEQRPGAGDFTEPVQIGDAAPYRTKLLFDANGWACWFQANAQGMYEVRSSLTPDVVLAAFHNTPKSRPLTKGLPVGPDPTCRDQPVTIFLDPDSGTVRLFRLAQSCGVTGWQEMGPIEVSPAYPVVSLEMDSWGLTSLLLRCYDPNGPGGNTFYATSTGEQPDLAYPMYWTPAVPASGWILNGRNEAMVRQAYGLIHFTYTYDGATPGIVAYTQVSGRTSDTTTLTSISGSPPSLACTTVGAGLLHDSIMFAGASRFGPIFQVEQLKYRARFNIPGNVPVQTLEVLNAPEKTNRAVDEIPIAVQGGAQPRMLLIKGNRLLLLNHSSYPIPGATPTVTPSPTPSPTPHGATPSPTGTPSVDSFLFLRDALIARRTPTAGQANAGDANADQVWDAADMVRFLGGGW